MAIRCVLKLHRNCFDPWSTRPTRDRRMPPKTKRIDTHIILVALLASTFYVNACEGCVEISAMSKVHAVARLAGAAARDCTTVYGEGGGIFRSCRRSAASAELSGLPYGSIPPYFRERIPEVVSESARYIRMRTTSIGGDSKQSLKKHSGCSQGNECCSEPAFWMRQS